MERLDIPPPATIDQTRPIREARDLGERWNPRDKIADDDASASRADIDGRDPGHDRYRTNAAATPESTGMIMPVVRENSSEASAATARPMCSGSTSRLRMVRWA